MSSARSCTLACAIALLTITVQARSEIVIDRSAFGTTVEVARGDTILVPPPMDAAKWQVDYSSAVLEMETPAAKAGSPGPQGWRFKAIAKGETDLSFVPVISSGAAPPRFTVTIKVQNP